LYPLLNVIRVIKSWSRKWTRHVERMEERKIQSTPGGKVNILGGHSIGNSKKKVYINMCPIPNVFRYLARSILNLARNIFLPSRRNAPPSEASVGCHNCC
jgi:hypothetical protein